MLDYVQYTNPKFFNKKYPNCTKGDIDEAIKTYYRNNPKEKYRPIVEVFILGCE